MKVFVSPISGDYFRFCYVKQRYEIPRRVRIGVEKETPRPKGYTSSKIGEGGVFGGSNAINSKVLIFKTETEIRHLIKNMLSLTSSSDQGNQKLRYFFLFSLWLFSYF